ncbi:hypothetical protein BJF78_14700 [Pseudonocardia sp. CNS-139]|nr:hypothetical protein BJF78_14700 [Pseudonocardia sp. CNS-139]
MIVRLSAAGVAVQDVDDLARLHVRTDLDADGLSAALETTGFGEPVDDDTVLLHVEALRSRAVLLTVASDWEARWTEMLAYAERKGWISKDGRSVQVHVER